MKNQLEKAINLAKITGDKIIVVDDDSNTGFVIANLDEYERLVKKNSASFIDVKSLTEEELLDKINRDIEIWKNENRDKEINALPGVFSGISEKLISSDEDGTDDDLDEENLYYYTEEEIDENKEEKNGGEEQEIREEQKNNWQISNDVKRGAEEVK